MFNSDDYISAHGFSTFRQIIDDFNAIYPYAMVQPILHNSNEYKKAAYISSIASGSKIHYGFACYRDIERICKLEN